MGHYTQIRGWLNVGRSNEHIDTTAARLETAKQDYANRYPDSRDWIYQGTHFPTENNGFNGECFMFIGVELKNYDDDYDRWLNVLLEHFPEADGRWDVQSEGRHPGDDFKCGGEGADNVLTIRIRDGKRRDDWEELCWC